MGWCGGSLLLGKIIDTISPEIGDPDKRFYIYLDLIDYFSDEDCDTLDECLGKDDEYDRAYEHWFRNTFGDEEWEDEGRPQLEWSQKQKRCR